MPRVINQLTETLEEQKRAVRQSTRNATAVSQAAADAAKKNLKRKEKSEQLPKEKKARADVQAVFQVAPPILSATTHSFFSGLEDSDTTSDDSSYSVATWRDETLLVPNDTSALFTQEAASDISFSLFATSSASTSTSKECLTPEEFEQQFNEWVGNDLKCD